jgi:hypothetical protein
MDPEEIGLRIGVGHRQHGLLHLAQDSDQWQALANTHLSSIKGRNFLARWAYYLLASQGLCSMELIISYLKTMRLHYKDWLINAV